MNHICNTSVDVDSGRRFISLLTCLFSITVAFICEIGSTLEISFAISPCKFGRADFPSVTHCDFFDLFTSPISNLIFESRRNITKKNIALSSHCRPKSCSFAAMWCTSDSDSRSYSFIYLILFLHLTYGMYLFVSVHVRIDFASFSRSGHVDEFESVSFQFVLRPEVSLFGCVGVAMSNDRNVSAACPSNTAAQW